MDRYIENSFVFHFCFIWIICKYYSDSWGLVTQRNGGRVTRPMKASLVYRQSTSERISKSHKLW